jgi:hypothetical protein
MPENCSVDTLVQVVKEQANRMLELRAIHDEIPGDGLLLSICGPSQWEANFK